MYIHNVTIVLDLVDIYHYLEADYFIYFFSVSEHEFYGRKQFSADKMPRNIISHLGLQLYFVYFIMEVGMHSLMF